MAYLVVTYPLVVVLGILVQPHLAQSYAVPLEHVHAAPPLVRRPFPEDVSHVWAGHDFQGAWNKNTTGSSLVQPRKRLIADGKGDGRNCVYFVAKRGCKGQDLSFFLRDFFLRNSCGKIRMKGWRSWLREIVERLDFDKDPTGLGGLDKGRIFCWLSRERNSRKKGGMRKVSLKAFQKFIEFFRVCKWVRTIEW